MKRSMKKLTVLVMIATIAIFIAGATASAHDDDWKALHGEYAMMGEGTCLFSLKGFNSNFTPIDPTHYPPWAGSSQATGIWIFEGNGKGTVRGTEFTLTLSPNPYPSAASAEFSFDFAYKVEDDGTITVDMLIETFQGKYLTGPSAGLTYKYETSPPIFRLFGMVSADRKTITLASGNDVQKISISNRITVFAICNLGRTLLRLGEVGNNPKKR
jgi:hypothetical protein